MWGLKHWRFSGEGEAFLIGDQVVGDRNDASGDCGAPGRGLAASSPGVPAVWTPHGRADSCHSLRGRDSPRPPRVSVTQ